MQKIILIGIFLIVLLSFLANPAPVSIEVADLLLIMLTVGLGVLSLASVTHYKIESAESQLLCAIILYLTYLVLSAWFGLLHGVGVLNMMRSLGPYVSFFPLLFIGFLPARLIKINMIGFVFVIVGMLQIFYLFYLYFSHASVINTTAGVLRNRITLMDPRTTLPFLLAVAILPSVVLLNKTASDNKMIRTAAAMSCILLGVIAGIMTLTRAIFLSMIVGWLCFSGLAIYYLSRFQSFSYTQFLRKAGIGLVGVFFILALISLIPSVHLLETGLLARFFDHNASGHVDYSDGRIYDEWLPALSNWIQSGWLSVFFGIGAGSAFTVLTGEERTYIHNLCIYSLVYGGLFGLFSCLWLYYTLLKTLILRAFQFNNLAYIAFSALLISLFFYGQLFAVHKGLAFNAMLFLIIGLAIRQPSKKMEL